jgi:hypothetical protein
MNLSRPRWRILAALGLLLVTGSACAEPREGFGLAIGPVFHHSHEVLDQGKGNTLNFNSAGIGLSGDAQFVLDAQWSANPFLQFSVERASGDITNYLGNAQAGLAIRRWSGDWYVAPILELNDEQTYQKKVIARSTFGPGIGFATGWESPTGLTTALQVDAPQLLNFSANSLHAGVWLTVGYRWH